MAQCNYGNCSINGDEIIEERDAKGRLTYGRNYEGCGPQWARDVYDYTHEYENDWLDRFDDAEGSTRNAFSGLFGNRRGRRDMISRPPRALRRGVRTEEVLEEAGFFTLIDKVEELTKKIEELTKTA